jgi:16S rRNA processing protein RimM
MKRRRQVPPGQPEKDPTTGSPLPGEPVFLAVGRLRRPHGIAGEMIMDVLTDFPERLQPGKTIYVGETHQPMVIAGVRGHDRALIIHLSGLDSPESAGRYRNLLMYVQAAELPKLPEGEYYHHQLLGLKVVDEAGCEVGRLDDILETGANDVYLVKTADGKEILLPAVEDVIIEVKLEQREIHVRLPEWL